MLDLDLEYLDWEEQLPFIVNSKYATYHMFILDLAKVWCYALTENHKGQCYWIDTDGFWSPKGTILHGNRKSNSPTKVASTPGYP